MVVLFAVLLWLACSEDAQAQGDSLLLAGARVLHPAGDRWLEERSVLVSGGRVLAISTGDAAPPGVPREDLSGLYLVPGLIDLHTHLLLHPYDEALWDDQVLRESLELRTVRATVAARATIEAGWTTIRDLGTEGAGFADVALRDAIAQDLIPGPRLVAVTRAIAASGCYGPSGFDPRWTLPKGAEEADGTEGVRRAVRSQVAAGADWIKVYADYRRAKGAPPSPCYSQEELDALVDEARSAGRPVASHATTEEGIRRSVLAGAATIEHGYGATEPALRLLRERGVVLCPTLAANEAAARYAGWEPGTPEPPRLRDVRAMVALALRLGVTIACGSDAGVFAHGDNVRELELLVDCGMSPAEALRSATRTAARVLGRDGELGRIAPGFVADLVAVADDPLRSPAALRRPSLVVRRGRIVVDRRNAERR